MKTSLQPKLVNGHTGDPALFVDILREKRALLFDCGVIHDLSPSEILRISDVFISHTHIDHFIGFDHLLRLHLGRGHWIRIFGPRGITRCVRGKLSGYTWNLIRHQRLVFEVREIDGDVTRISEFHCRWRFRQINQREAATSDVIFSDDLISVRMAALDHRTTSLAFAVSERDFYNVDTVALKACGHPPGPWLNVLKHWVRDGRPDGVELQIEGRPHAPAALADALLIIGPGRTIAYVADSIGNQENKVAAVALARDADVLFCEASFLHEDLPRAQETYHLTARQAGEIARAAGVGRLVVFHYSPKYDGRFEELEAEAEEAFRATQPG